jgi:hypothetical protein
MDEEEPLGPRQLCPPIQELPIGDCDTAAKAHDHLLSEYTSRYKYLGLLSLADRFPISYDPRTLALALADACAQVADSHECGKAGEACEGGEGAPCAGRYEDVKIIMTTKFTDCIALQQNTEGDICLLRVIRSNIYNRVNSSRGVQQGTVIPPCFAQAVRACFGEKTCPCTGIYSSKHQKTSSCDKCLVITGDLLDRLTSKEPLSNLHEREIRAIFDLSLLKYEGDEKGGSNKKKK